MANRKLGPDGAINVRKGDSISKIAAELFNVAPSQTQQYWNDFKRPVTNNYGKVIGFKDLENVNTIYAGEVLYYRGGQLLSLPQAEVNAKAWVQVRFRLIIDYAKISIKVAEASYFHGRLLAKFSDRPKALYAWDSFRTLGGGATASLKFDIVDAGVWMSKWSSPFEFSYHEFDPRNYWRDVHPILGISVGDLKFENSVLLSLRLAFPVNNNFIRKNGSSDKHAVSKRLEAVKKSASQFPSVSVSFGGRVNLKGFRELTTKEAQ